MRGGDVEVQLRPLVPGPRVGIVDDKIEDVAPLLAALSRMGIPAAWFAGNEKSTLPKEPLKNVRLLFLDLNLQDGAGFDPKTTAGAIFNTIAPTAQSGPLLILVWTTHTDYLDDFRKEFDKYNGRLAESDKICPLAIDSIGNKASYIDPFKREATGSESSNSATGTQGTFRTVAELEQAIREMIAQLSPCDNLLDWEVACAEKAAEAVTMFSELSGSPCTDTTAWKARLKAILHRTTKAAMGKQCPDDVTDEAATGPLYRTLMSVLEDMVVSTAECTPARRDSEDESKKTCAATPRTTPPSTSVDKKIISIINKHLLTSEETNPRATGSVLTLDQLDKTLAPKFLSTDVTGAIIRPAIDAILHESKREYAEENHTALIMEVSPSCDVAQDKRRALKFVLGFSCPLEAFKNQEFVSGKLKEIGPLIINDKPSKIILDSTTLFTMDLDATLPSPIFRFRKPVCTDVQAWLAGQLARPGYTSLR